MFPINKQQSSFLPSAKLVHKETLLAYQLSVESLSNMLCTSDIIAIAHAFRFQLSWKFSTTDHVSVDNEQN